MRCVLSARSVAALRVSSGRCTISHSHSLTQLGAAATYQRWALRHASSSNDSNNNEHDSSSKAASPLKRFRQLFQSAQETQQTGDAEAKPMPNAQNRDISGHPFGREALPDFTQLPRYRNLQPGQSPETHTVEEAHNRSPHSFDVSSQVQYQQQQDEERRIAEFSAVGAKSYDAELAETAAREEVENKRLESMYRALPMLQAEKMPDPDAGQKGKPRRRPQKGKPVAIATRQVAGRLTELQLSRMLILHKALPAHYTPERLGELFHCPVEDVVRVLSVVTMPYIWTDSDKVQVGEPVMTLPMRQANNARIWGESTVLSEDQIHQLHQLRKNRAAAGVREAEETGSDSSSATLRQKPRKATNEELRKQFGL